MEIILQSFLFITATEMGDKTQLLAFILASRFKKPWPIFWGIFVATVLNHLLAAYAGKYLSGFFNGEVLDYIVAAIFFIFGVWVLIPDSDEGLKTKTKYGPFVTTVIAFFLAEMGDKTQLSTVALAAQHRDVAFVTIGTTLGMMVSDGLAVFFGDKMTKFISMKMIHQFAAALFFIFGGLLILKHLNF